MQQQIAKNTELHTEHIQLHVVEYFTVIYTLRCSLYSIQSTLLHNMHRPGLL